LRYTAKKSSKKSSQQRFVEGGKGELRAQASQINPLAYLADVLDKLPARKVNNIEGLLPWNWKPDNNRRPPKALCRSCFVTSLRDRSSGVELLVQLLELPDFQPGEGSHDVLFAEG